MQRRSPLITSSLILALLAAPSAGARGAADAEATEQGKRLFEQGLLRYDTAEYDQAISLFRQAYERTQAPALLFNMAQAHRLKGDCQKAVALYRQFVRLDPASPDRERAESRVAELEPCSTTAAASPAPPTPVGSQRLVSAPASIAADVTRTRAKAGPGWNVASIAVGSVALALGGAAGIYGQRAAQSSDRVTELFERGGAWNADVAAADADGRSAQQTATVLLVAAAATALMSVALFAYGRLTK